MKRSISGVRRPRGFFDPHIQNVIAPDELLSGIENPVVDVRFIPVEYPHKAEKIWYSSSWHVERASKEHIRAAISILWRSV